MHHYAIHLYFESILTHHCKLLHTANTNKGEKSSAFFYLDFLQCHNSSV